jgi:hypothetical protein
MVSPLDVVVDVAVVAVVLVVVAVVVVVDDATGFESLPHATSNTAVDSAASTRLTRRVWDRREPGTRDEGPVYTTS